MSKSQANRLRESGLPLFFKVANPEAVGITPPDNRLGEALTTWVRSLSVMQKDALVASSRTGAVWRLASDEGGYLAGHDEAPCPLAFLTVGMIASYANEITALAAQRGVAVRHLKLLQDNRYTMEGSMLKGTLVSGALPPELTVEIDCDADGPALQDLVLSAVAAAPLNGLLRGELTSMFTLSRNGAALAPDRVAPLGHAPLPDPGDHFDVAAPAPPELDGPLVWKTPDPPLAEDADGYATDPGSTAHGDARRDLHLGGICTLRPDGLKEITQLLHSPRGTSFTFLSEEGPDAGGQSRAPDANTYVSAGIGFCFMTQFGRYVSMMKKTMDDYRIVQDTHFSLGGASGGTGQAGAADPVETHVYLETPEDEAFARRILDVAEGTCFLHALCGTDLKTKVRVREAVAG
ncbi:MAG: OsmC family peroxiredoxin [Alphaproteobacteria bacterium]|nr:OsmC family peroxiredoxin [Alphaproteobacteria bacterium]